MKLTHRNWSTGFTIVEVMIVLAVTGVLFIGVALAVSGKQQTAEFNSAINDVQAQIQQVINEVSSGFYPNSGDLFGCTTNGSGIAITSHSAASQGTNSGCVFVGKALHFSDGTSIPNSQFITYPIAAAQAATGALSTADPTLLGGQPDADGVDDTTINNLEYGLNVISMYSGTTANPVGSVAFVQSLGNSDADGLISGAQNLDLVVPNAGQGSDLTSSTSGEATTLDTLLRGGNYTDSATTSTASVSICFASGTTNQSGLITIGNSDNSLAVNLTIFSDGTCT